jgi:hypothetical protein
MTMATRNNPLDPYDLALLYVRMNIKDPKCIVTGRIVGEECLLCDIHSCSGYKKERKKFLKEFVHWWRDTHEHHCLTKDELWEKAGTREPITREDIGLPPGSQDGLESHPYW